MLAQLERELPVGDFVYEPKWDGFRCLAFGADLRSRHGRPLGRYFPEIVEALQTSGSAFDGELLVAGAEGSDFAALLNRLHPSRSRVEELRRATPASYVVFDLLDEPDRPFAERRSALERLALRPPLSLTPVTSDPAVAREWLKRGKGIDGVVAKRRDQPYQPGRRGWIRSSRSAPRSAWWAASGQCWKRAASPRSCSASTRTACSCTWASPPAFAGSSARRSSRSWFRSRPACAAIPGSTASISAVAPWAGCPAPPAAGWRARWSRTGCRCGRCASAR